MGNMKEIQDAAVTGRVMSAIGIDPEVDINEIYADTVDGVVRLQGVVDKSETKERAEEVVRALPGVRGVENALAVRSRGGLTDEEIAHAVDAALAEEASLDATEIGVKVADGVVTLSGRVDSVSQEQLAMHLAGGVDGVKRVTTELHKERAGPTDDATFRNDVEQVLSDAAEVDATFIQVGAKNGVITLTGRVVNGDDLCLAEQLTASVPGVRRVVNKLRVEKT